MSPTGIQNAVWPVWTYPTDTSDWTQEDYRQWEMRFRPPGYTGGMYDYAAWQQHNAPPSITDQLASIVLPLISIVGIVLVGRWIREGRK